jgi:hypothetical protein
MRETITPSTPKAAFEEAPHRFESWRKHTRIGSRIPEGLWQAAVGLAKTDHGSCTAKKLDKIWISAM